MPDPANAAERPPPEIDVLAARKSLEDFLRKNLRKPEVEAIPSAIEAIETAAREYERLNLNREQWIDYKKRNSDIQTLGLIAEEISSRLNDIDFISMEVMRNAIKDFDVNKLAQDLRVLHACCVAISNSIQSSGRPRDIAEEIWVRAIVRIYTDYLGETGKQLPTQRFLKFLRLCRPHRFRGKSYEVQGALGLKQVARSLSRTDLDLNVVLGRTFKSSKRIVHVF